MTCGTGTVIVISHVGVQGPAGPAGPSGGDASSWTYYTFAYGDSSPVTLLTVAANKRVLAAVVSITETFNGSGASIKLGDASNSESVMAAADIYPSQQSTFQSNPQTVWGSSTALILTITPGSGATQGRGVIALQIQP